LLLELIIIDVVWIIIPDMDVVLDEESDIRVTSEEPQELSDDSFPVDFFRREEWKSICEIKAKLTSEKTIRHISTSEIFIIDTVFDKVSPEVEVLLFWMDRHRKNVRNYRKELYAR
jgi:hypothetical protein